tara:strand:+ start:100 stop:525 length:426 start_codon:yes stop_codon:yes gene_type:complete
MNKHNAEEFARDIKEMMKEYGLPYVEITIYNENLKDESRSPLKHVSLKMESLINALLGDMMFAGMEEAGFIINQLENQVGDLLTLSAYLRLKHERNKLNNVLKGKIENVMKQKNAVSVPIPEVFREVLKEIAEKDKKKGSE